MTARRVFAITGKDREHFLQGLVTNDIAKARGGIAYAALLTPQGKFIADFFLVGQPDRILLDAAADGADALVQRLSMYRLRADVQISETDLVVSRGSGPAPDGALPDPRDPARAEAARADAAAATSSCRSRLFGYWCWPCRSSRFRR